MKGVVFVELLEMLEERFGLEVSDRIITDAELPNGGAYTSVGTYPHEEAVRILIATQRATDIPIPELLRVFGHHLFKVFYSGYPQFFKGIEHPFGLLSKVDDYIHIEVLKLYPDAKLPKFEHEVNDNVMQLTYTSPREMSSLALGLIEATRDHYGTDIQVETANLDKTGQKVLFTLTSQNG